jgi:hypothetical protein
VDGAKVLSDTALKQLHMPVMIGGVSIGEFGERLPMGYALGCQVESYRGRRVIRHGGNLVGYSSDVCVAPDAKAAVVVLTNLHGTGLRDAVALMVLDRLLGLEPMPWGERYHELFTAFRGGAVQASKHRLQLPPGRPVPRPLGDYAGVYEHPAYGAFDVTVEGDGLTTDFHGLRNVVSLVHRDGDAWDFRLDDFDSAIPLVFRSGLTGEVDALAVALEPTVDPIVFTRKPEWPSEDVLDELAGSYAMGPFTAKVERHDGGLRVTLPMAGTLRLEPSGKDSFKVPGASGYALSFARDADGLVDRLVVHPIGLFDRVKEDVG